MVGRAILQLARPSYFPGKRGWGGGWKAKAIFFFPYCTYLEHSCFFPYLGLIPAAVDLEGHGLLQQRHQAVRGHGGRVCEGTRLRLH